METEGGGWFSIPKSLGASSRLKSTKHVGSIIKLGQEIKWDTWMEM